jgi:hypothetical protein
MKYVVRGMENIKNIIVRFCDSKAGLLSLLSSQLHCQVILRQVQIPSP